MAGMLTTAKPVHTLADEPMQFATFDDGEGLVETVLDAYCPQTPGFFLYYPSRHQVMPKLRAFIDHATMAIGVAVRAGL